MNPAKRSNYAFIDSQNLYLGVSNDVINKKGKKIYTGQYLDYRKFRTYLREKYNVKRAYIFIGFIPTNNKLYSYLQEAGYTIIFKTISTYMDEKGDVQTKGNVDTDIVLYAAAILADEYKQAIFVSGDGDFLSLYKYLNDQGKLDKILVPNRHRYSQLLNEYREQLRFISDLKPLYRPNKKTRSGGRSATLGLPSHGDVKIVAKTSVKVKTTKERS
jgi:uncharacterized LabA/DUF88 family protein